MKPVMEVPFDIVAEDRAALEADGWLVIRNPAPQRSAARVVHFVANASTAPVVVDVGETDTPPDVVMAAMKRISPIKDKTYEANYAYWEANKERAAAYPKEFAEEIINGASAGVE